MRHTLSLIAASALAAVAGAQTSIGNGVIRSGGTVIDANGVHTATADIGAGGVRAHGDGGTTIRTNGNRRHVVCGGGALSVDGNGNILDVEDCRRLTLNGNDNIVNAHFPAPGQALVAGNHNRLAWSAAPHVRVGVSNLGTGNVVNGR